jgi:hypothetical protein
MNAGVKLKAGRSSEYSLTSTRLYCIIFLTLVFINVRKLGQIWNKSSAYATRNGAGKWLCCYSSNVGQCRLIILFVIRRFRTLPETVHIECEFKYFARFLKDNSRLVSPSRTGRFLKHFLNLSLTTFLSVTQSEIYRHSDTTKVRSKQLFLMNIYTSHIFVFWQRCTYFGIKFYHHDLSWNMCAVIKTQ